jgi:hypothetical protein
MATGSADAMNGTDLYFLCKNGGSALSGIEKLYFGSMNTILVVEGSPVLDDVWLYLTAVLGLIAVVLFVILIMEREKRKPLSKAPAKPVPSEVLGMWPPAASRTVTSDVVKGTMDKLRVLDLEREILSYAVRRLYEAHAEGKITEDEREGLMLKYKDDLRRIREEMGRGESIVALNEMERMQEEFVRLFSDRFEELNKRIKELRTVSGIAPPEPEEPLAVEELKEAKVASPPRREREVSRPKAPSAKPEKGEAKKAEAEGGEPEKSDAEKKIAQIVSDVEKVLEKLGQMEAEE